MESLSLCLSSSPPLPNHPKTHKLTSKSNSLLPNSLPNCISSSNSTSHPCNSHQTNFSFTNRTFLITHPHPHPLPLNHQPNKMLKSQSPNPFMKNKFPILNTPSFLQIFLNCMGFSFPLSCFASEINVTTDQVSNKINLEAILVSIDEFFNRYPFFVAGVTFIWLVVIPLTEEYLQKYKFISAIDAFRKLRDDPNAQLLDIRDKKGLGFLGSPNLKILNKSVVQVEFSDGDEESFVKMVLEKLREHENTTVCILDNFDGNSMKVAELLFNNGFKEAYAIRGGVRGKNGWLAIQETLLPPSVHIFPKKKVKRSQQFEMNGGTNQQSEDNEQFSFVGRSEQMDNGYVKKSIEPTPKTKHGPRSLSPYPKYPDMKPPSSPTPSKPQN